MKCEQPPVAKRIAAHSSAVTGIKVLDEAHSGDQVGLASCGLDGLVGIWDHRTGGQLCSLQHFYEGQRGPGSADSVRNSPSKVESREAVSVLGIDSTGEHKPQLCSAVADGTIWLWDVASAKLSRRIRAAHSGPVTSIKIARMETGRIVTGSSDNTVKVWDMRQRRPLVHTFRGHSGPITTVVVESSTGTIFSGSKALSVTTT